ncbi:toprim domain-containing protein [Sunxiuqinia sp. A32]|uniref:toprim domain-containing protein n=1 Tax=Sunxiuqinia sp. A32 TaxID=3461496 RepID=UPI0040465179
MNCEQAKQIKIVDFLSSTGRNPARVYGDYAWYNSPLPFRNDSNPSFKVNISKNIWIDVATGEGGNILDLVMAMNSTSVTGALMILQKPELSKHSFSFSEKQKSPGIKINHIQPLQNRALIEYVENRGIPADIASRYLMEAYYKTYPDQEKAFFALAFKNDKGGHELRNGNKTAKQPQGYKVKATPNYVTTIPGNNNTLNVFEGFMDFLSAMVYFKTKKPAHKTIILNSVVNLNYIESLLKSARKINLYLDNDDSGITAVERVKELNPKVTNYSTIIYPQYKDFNQFLNSNDYENKRII